MSSKPRSPKKSDSLKLDHLRAFIATIDAGSQTGAARELNTAPATISRYIERVQAHFGGGLFEADTGRLSTRGMLVEQSARRALAELARTRDRVDPSVPVLRVGYIRAMRTLVERALREQQQGRRSRDFEVRLVEMNSDVQARSLAHGELDIGLCYVTRNLKKLPGVEVSVLAEEPFALVAPQSGWRKGKLANAALQPLPHVRLLERLSPDFAEAASAWLRRNNLQPERAVECDQGSEILAYACAGCGFGFLPALWSTTNHEGALFVPAQDFGVTVEIAAYSLRHVTALVARLRDNLASSVSAALRDFRAPSD